MPQNFEISGHLEVKNGHLYVEDTDCVELAERLGTPLYVSGEHRIRQNIRTMQRAFPDASLLYAVKANGNLAILRIMAQEGMGADVFSLGELHLALLARIPREKILFNGNSKSPQDLKAAVECGVMVSVDSQMEAEQLSNIAYEHARNVRIAIRVNPAISPQTHPKIATGLKSSKFGIPHEQVAEVYGLASSLPGIAPVGIHCHIGSQILSTEPFVETIRRVMALVEQINEMGIELEFVDIGSGLGIPYDKATPAPTPHELARAVLPVFEQECERIGVSPTLVLEPGRYVVADSTVMLTKVNTIKHAHLSFVGVDAGFNMLVRPAMYDAHHHVVVANRADAPSEREYTVVGPICESGDILARDVQLPSVRAGDVLAVLDAGAYGFSMSSQYNGRPRGAEVLVSGSRADLIRKPEGVDDLLANQLLPERLL
ncbi:MAG: diaminopimelate decarboxylase [Methermicoccaceae archaeon]